MNRIGIMQGRLVPPEGGRFQSFPRDGWRSEFHLAALAGLDAIEWIYDAYSEDMNPIANESGACELESLREETSVDVVSICADYFMDHPVVRAGPEKRYELLDHLRWLIERAKRVGIERIVLPFVDASRIVDEDDESIAVDFLLAAAPAAHRANVEIHLEADLAPAAFAVLLSRLAHPAIRVNYDAGNSASLGYDPLEEFARYGKQIGSVHIKDRVRGGGTVALGTGSANLPAVFQGLHSLNYRGDYVLQAARGKVGDEARLAAENRALVVNGIKSAAGMPQTSPP